MWQRLQFALELVANYITELLLEILRILCCLLDELRIAGEAFFRFDQTDLQLHLLQGRRHLPRRKACRREVGVDDWRRLIWQPLLIGLR